MFKFSGQNTFGCKFPISKICRASKMEGYPEMLLKNISFCDKLVGQILLKIEEFPSILSVEEQGMFILGYYHQREDIYTSNKNKEES